MEAAEAVVVVVVVAVVAVEWHLRQLLQQHQLVVWAAAVAVAVECKTSNVRLTGLR